MGRNVKPGISFYRIDSGHILNKKIRLLCNEFDSDGYYIWSCLLDYAYNKWGYYFDTNDQEEVDLFASEYCKKKLTLVKEVIHGCIRRNLFDKDVADLSRILTSQMMQEVFIYATAERRRQGSIFEMKKEWLKIDFGDDMPKNIKIVPVNLVIPHVNNPQTRQDKTETKQNNVVPEKPAPPKKVSKQKVEEPEPFWQQLVDTWFVFGEEKFGIKPSFERDDPKILKRIVQRLKKRAAEKKVEWNQHTGPQRLRIFLESAFTDKWLSEHFLLSNLEKQFDKIIQNQSAKKKALPVIDLQYLFERFCEGDMDNRLIVPKHFEELNKQNLVHIDHRIITRRMETLAGGNKFSDTELYKDYEAGRTSKLTEQDKPVLMRLAVIEYFKKLKEEKFQSA
jgi:hypothetical protein